MKHRCYQMLRVVVIMLSIGLLLQSDIVNAAQFDPCQGSTPPTDGSLSCEQKRTSHLGIYQYNVDACAADPTTTAGSPITMPTDMTLENKISQTFILGIDTDSVSTDQLKALITKYPYIGGIYFTGHPPQHGYNSDFLKSLDDIAKVPLIIASDEEGGSVQRFADDTTVGAFDSAGKMGQETAESVKAIGSKVGVSLSAIGVNVDLAPVLDTYKNIANSDNITGDSSKENSRSFGTSGGSELDSANIATKAGAFAEGLASAGIAPVYKHFPDLGQVAGNTDTQPVTLPALSDLADGISPYKAVANKNNGAVMLSNAFVPDWNGGNLPTSISSDAVTYLRGSVGFSGLVTTDDLSAIGKGSYGSKAVALPDAVTKALGAGVTMPLFAYSDDATLDSIVQKVKADGTASNNVDTALTEISDFKGNVTDNTASPSTGCCSTGSSDSVVALSGEDNPRIIYNYLTSDDRGAGKFNAITASAAVGNFMRESGGGDPKSVNSIGASGIAQWLGGRKDALYAYAKAHNSTWDDMQMQLGYLWTEITGSKASVVADVKAATTIEDATNIWSDRFEVSGDPEPEKRVINAQAMYAIATGKATTWPPNVPVATDAVPGGGSSTPAAGTQAAASSSASSGCSSSLVNVDGDAKALAQQILDSTQFDYNPVAKEDLDNTASGKGSLSGCGDIRSIDKDLLATLLKTSAKYKMFLGNFITGRACETGHPKGWAVDIMAVTDNATGEKSNFCARELHSTQCPHAKLDGEFAQFLADNMPQNSIINQTGCAGRTTVVPPPGVEAWTEDWCDHQHINVHQDLVNSEGL